MRDILPFYFNRLEGEVVFVDPKAETRRFWKETLQNDRKNPRAIYCGDHKQPNACIIGKPGKGKTIHPIEDETHKFFDPETDKIVRSLDIKRRNASKDGI